MSAPAPVVSDGFITFQVSDADHQLDGVRLELDWNCDADTLDFALDPAGWSLTIPTPPARRLEYQLTLRTGDHYEWTIDHANPRRVGNPFGDKSELLLPGYTPPAWLDAPDIGVLSPVDTGPGELEVAIPVRVWAPAGLEPDRAAPLLVVHDGSDMADRGSILQWASSVIDGPNGPGPFRVALLDPPHGHRDGLYAGNDAYSDHLVSEVLPVLELAAPATVVVGLGASLGAVAIAALQDRHPRALDAMALQSGSFFTADLDPQESSYSRFAHLCQVAGSIAARVDHRPVPTLMTCGTLEENRANNEAMATALSGQGFPVRWRLVPDAHTMVGWRDAWGHDLADLIVAAEQGWKP